MVGGRRGRKGEEEDRGEEAMATALAVAFVTDRKKSCIAQDA